MNLAEQIRPHGKVYVEHYRDGELISFAHLDNLVVTAGKARVASMLIGTVAGWTHMAIGNSNTAVAAGDTTLTSEVQRVATSNSTSTNQATFSGSFIFSGTDTIQEAGLFTASSGGVMLSHVLLGPFAVESGDTLVITWVITVS